MYQTTFWCSFDQEHSFTTQIMEDEFLKGFCLFHFCFQREVSHKCINKSLRTFGILVDEEVTDSGLQIKWDHVTPSLYVYARGNNILFIQALEEKGNGKRMVFS